jgi:exopolysaccharide production protein ExoZ
MVAGGILGLFPNLMLTTQHIVASLFFIPVRSPSSGEIWPVLVQGWTLNFEMFFYLIFALSKTGSVAVVLNAHPLFFCR